MGLISKFEGAMEDTVEGAAEKMGGSSLSPVQIAKKAEKQMRREKMVGAGKQFAPTLYTVLISHDDDARMFGYYPTLAGETETYLTAKAQEHGLVMDGQPLVRFIADDGLKRGKFEVIAEMVAAPLIRQLRQEEMERYGLAKPRNDAYEMGAAPSGRRQPPVQAQPAAAPMAAQNAYPPATVPVQSPAQPDLNAIPMADPNLLDPALNMAVDPLPGGGAIAAGAVGAAADPLAGIGIDPLTGAAAVASAAPVDPVSTGLEAAALPGGYVDPSIPAYADGTFGDPYISSLAQPAAAAQPQQLKAAPMPDVQEQAVQPFRGQAPIMAAELFDRTNNQVFPLTGAPMRIGRESARDIVVPDINASRTHAEIHQEPSGTWIVADLGSTNGTFLNGRQIKSAPLRPGDTIVIGTTELVFRAL